MLACTLLHALTHATVFGHSVGPGEPAISLARRAVHLHTDLVPEQRGPERYVSKE